MTPRDQRLSSFSFWRLRKLGVSESAEMSVLSLMEVSKRDFYVNGQVGQDEVCD